MARVIRVVALSNIGLVEEHESRDCWMCVHIEKDNEYYPQPVCEACKWWNPGGFSNGLEDNYRERPDGRWKG